MYTVKQESEENNHYQDFQTTVEFLMQPDQLSEFNEGLDDYRKRMMRVAEDGVEGLKPVKERLESSLRKVMARTERLTTGEDRNAMLKEVSVSPKVKADDVRDFLSMQKIASEIESRGVMEFWKSAPYLLNFMEKYDIKRRFKKRIDEFKFDPDLRKAIKSSKTALLSRTKIEAYGDINQGNAKLRSMHAMTVENGAWKLLWIPPSLPYYQPGGSFADPKVSGFTKKLVFSNWQVVPKAIASMLSYSAERNMIKCHESAPENTADARKSRRPLIRFSVSDGRLTAMSGMTLIYPSLYLAKNLSLIHI